MNDKDNKRLMQCLLIACAFVLVLLYLYFTKGACLEMNTCAKVLMSIAGIAFLIGIGCLMWNCIWNSDKKDISIFCCNYEDSNKKSCCCNEKKCSVKIDGDESFIYIAKKDKDSITIPDGIKNVVVQKLDDLKKGDKTQELKNVYVVCQKNNEVSAEDISSFEFKNAKIHFNTNGEMFTVKTKTKPETSKIDTSSDNADGDAEKNNDEIVNSDEQPSSGGK